MDNPSLRKTVEEENGRVPVEKVSSFDVYNLQQSHFYYGNGELDLFYLTKYIPVTFAYRMTNSTCDFGRKLQFRLILIYTTECIQIRYIMSNRIYSFDRRVRLQNFYHPTLILLRDNTSII